jgi:hypothetical protein
MAAILFERRRASALALLGAAFAAQRGVVGEVAGRLR